MSSNQAIRMAGRGTLACCCLLAGRAELRAQQTQETQDAEDSREPMVAAASSPLADASELEERLDRLLRDPALARAHVGLIVQVAETGEVLFETEAERRFTPASNTKIVTAAVALDQLGPEYRWPTRLIASGPILGGRLDGSLWVIGSGAPELKRAEVAAWATALRAAGLEEITGDVVGDDPLEPSLFSKVSAAVLNFFNRPGIV